MDTNVYLPEGAVILIVDDSPDDLYLMSNLLKKDYTVKELWQGLPGYF